MTLFWLCSAYRLQQHWPVANTFVNHIMLICFTVSRNTDIVNQAETSQNPLWSSQPADPNKQPTSSLPVKNNTWNTSHKYFSSYLPWKTARPLLFITQGNRKHLQRSQTLSEHQHNSAHWCQWESTLGSVHRATSCQSQGFHRDDYETTACIWFYFLMKLDPTLRATIMWRFLWQLAWLICIDSCALTPGISRCSCK